MAYCFHEGIMSLGARAAIFFNLVESGEHAQAFCACSPLLSDSRDCPLLQEFHEHVD
jgi:hypothetical protein